jgi:hypothetical protein
MSSGVGWLEAEGTEGIAQEAGIPDEGRSPHRESESS